MPHVNGEEILAELARRDPDLPVVVITAEQEVRSAVRCMKLGAVDCAMRISPPTHSERRTKRLHRAFLRPCKKGHQRGHDSWAPKAKPIPMRVMELEELPRDFMDDAEISH